MKISGTSTMMRRRSTIALWCYPLKVDREKIIKKKVNGWILLIYQPNIIFLVCSVVKQQISSQKNNIWTLVIKNMNSLTDKDEIFHTCRQSPSLTSSQSSVDAIEQLNC